MGNHHAIYIIKSIITDRIYVGSAVNYNKRFKQHCYNLFKNKHCNIKIQNHFNKYGKEDLIYEVIEFVELKENLINREQHYIDTLRPFFNICQKAGNTLGYKKPIEKIEKEIKFKLECEVIKLKNKPITDLIDSVIYG
jgi:group I intron endonuclease